MPSKSARQQNPAPQPVDTMVNQKGKVNLARGQPGISGSDSALHRGAEFRPLQHHVQFPRTSPVHHRHSMKSAELRRKSETSLITQHAQYPRQMRCKSDLDLKKDKTELSSGDATPRKIRTVPRDTLATPRRSTGHVSRLPVPRGHVVTRQPARNTSRSIPGPDSNPDWPVLSESDYENVGDNSVILGDPAVAYGNGRYGASSVTEGVKGLMKLLYHPFQCCQRKVGKLKYISE